MILALCLPRRTVESFRYGSLAALEGQVRIEGIAAPPEACALLGALLTSSGLAYFMTHPSLTQWVVRS